MFVQVDAEESQKNLEYARQLIAKNMANLLRNANAKVKATKPHQNPKKKKKLQNLKAIF
jgi:CRISPR/Cas system-associated endonuclease Cas1